MKKIISLMLAICAVCSCCDTPQVKDSQIVSSGGDIVKEVEIKGHIYLIFDGYYKGNIIHAEHCPCKNTEH